MRINAFLLLIFLGSIPTNSYTQDVPENLLRLSIAPLNGAIEYQLESVLRGTIELVLAQSVFLASNPGNLKSADGEPQLELKVLYTMRGSRVALLLSLIDTSLSTRLYGESMERDLDPQFDLAVSVFVSALLREGSALMGESPAFSRAFGATLASTPSEEPSPEGKPGIVVGTREPESLPLMVKDPSSRAHENSSSFEVGLGAFFPLEEAGLYFTAASRLHIRYGHYLNKGRNWNLGVAGSFIAFSVNGETPESVRNYIAMIGGEIDYGFMLARRIAPWLALGAGPSLIVIDSEGKSPVSKALAHVYTGLGASFHFSQNLDIGLGVSLSLFFDYGSGASSIFMGITPSLSARLEL